MHIRERLLGDMRIRCILFLASVVISQGLISRQQTSRAVQSHEEIRKGIGSFL